MRTSGASSDARLRTPTPTPTSSAKSGVTRRRWLAGDQFDAVMNYPFTRSCLGFFAGPDGPDQETIKSTGLDPVEVLTVDRFAQALESNLRRYPWTNVLAQLNLLDSHDTTRFLRMVRGDQNALKLAWLLQMTFPGAPCVYYGDEVGFDGDDEAYGARRSFSWDRSTWNEELLAYLKGLIRLRHETEVLRRGDFATLLASDDVYAFARIHDQAIAVVVINNGSPAKRVDVPLLGGMSVTDCKLAWGERAPEATGTTLGNWYVPGRSGAVLIGSLHTG